LEAELQPPSAHGLHLYSRPRPQLRPGLQLPVQVPKPREFSSMGTYLSSGSFLESDIDPFSWDEARPETD
jgi:hypothetical protein